MLGVRGGRGWRRPAGQLRGARSLGAGPIRAHATIFLPQAVPGMAAVVSQIMAIPPQMLISQDNQPFPPALFVHMARDTREGMHALL